MALGLATIVTAIITLDGESHWFEGVQLLAVYGMVAVGAFFWFDLAGTASVS